MNNEIALRKAEISDVGRLNALLFQVQKAHSDVRPDLFAVGAKKYTDAELKDIIEDESKPIFVAVADGEVAGYIFCVIKDGGKNPVLNDIKTLYVDDLGVDINFRGRGIGKKLYTVAVEFARKSGCYNLTLNVWADNKNAVAFYNKLGMRIQKIGMEQILQ